MSAPSLARPHPPQTICVSPAQDIWRPSLCCIAPHRAALARPHTTHHLLQLQTSRMPRTALTFDAALSAARTAHQCILHTPHVRTAHSTGIHLRERSDPTFLPGRRVVRTQAQRRPLLLFRAFGYELTQPLFHPPSHWQDFDASRRVSNTYATHTICRSPPHAQPSTCIYRNHPSAPPAGF